MPHTALQPCTRTISANCPAAEALEHCVPERNRPAGKLAIDSVSAQAVGQALCATGYPALRDIQIEIERGVVVLWGRVPTYHQKQVAQVTVQRVEGVRGIANGIEVNCSRSGAGSQP